MAINFYMKKGSGSEYDIESNFSIRVTSVRGLNPPQPKDLFVRDWAEEDGVDVYVPQSGRKRKSSEVTMTIWVEDSTTGQPTSAIERFRAFCDYLFDGTITYRDTLQNQVVSLIYNANKPEWYQFVGHGSLMAEISFLNPTGAVTKYVQPQ